MHKNDELMHYGVKGQKWGVRKEHVRGDLEDATGGEDVTDDDYRKVTGLYELSKEHDFSRLSNLNKAFEDAKAKIAGSNTQAARDRIQAILDSEKDNKTGTREKKTGESSGTGGGGGATSTPEERQRNINLKEKGKTLLADTTKEDDEKKKVRHGEPLMSDTDYLAHHGVDGQKWGVRNGPPYPIENPVLKKGTRINNVQGYSSREALKAGGNLSGKDRLEDGRWVYTYNPKDAWDRKVYTGPYALYLQSIGKAYVVEHKYEVVKDLKMPTRKQRMDEFVDLLNDRNYKKAAIKELKAFQSRAKDLNYPEKLKERILGVNVKKMRTKEDFENAYTIFNLMMGKQQKYKITNEYAHRISKKYDAMVDDNDAMTGNKDKDDAFATHDPVIIFRAQEVLKALPSSLVKHEKSKKNVAELFKAIDK